MPETFQALVVLTLFIVPGFLFRTGYIRTRAHGALEADLYAVAEAVAISLILLAGSWWFTGREIVDWAAEGSLRDHKEAVYYSVVVLLAVSFLAGLVSGWLVNTFLRGLRWTRRRYVDSGIAWVFDVLDRSGLFAAPTVWDEVWNRIAGDAPVYVRIRTRSGQEVIGSFDRDSWAGLSPEPSQVYLSKVYLEKEAGKWEAVPQTKGVFLHASEIESIEFAGS